MELTELCKIMNQSGSDKGSGWHNYTRLYHDWFNDKREDNINIFELGIGTNKVEIPSNMSHSHNYTPGGSIRGWKEFFPNSTIYAADIDKDILINDDRVKSFFCDQTNATSIKNMWNNPDMKNVEFDIMIDDGLHELNANLTFFLNSFYKLKSTGIYIIEDIHIHMIPMFNNTFSQLKNSLNFVYTIYNLNNPVNTIDNVLMAIYKNN